MNHEDLDSRDAEERLKQQAEKNRLEHFIKQLLNKEFDKHREWFEVTYEGYDARNGLHTVKKSDGSTIYAQVTSNLGQIAKGETLVAFCPSSSYARLFMPL